MFDWWFALEFVDGRNIIKMVKYHVVIYVRIVEKWSDYL
jgi:hypothetical protein